MTTIVSRLYATQEQAAQAAEMLTSTRFSAADVNLVTPPTEPDSAPEALEGLIQKGGVRRADAAVFAKAVAEGKSLVTVRAAWSLATPAIHILEHFEPIASGVGDHEQHIAETWHSASPFSDFLGWPTLIDSKSSSDLLDGDSSSSLGLPTVIRARPFSALSKNDKAFSALAKSDKPFSKLIDKAAPFSALFGLPVILKSPTRRRA